MSPVTHRGPEGAIPLPALTSLGGRRCSWGSSHASQPGGMRDAGMWQDMGVPGSAGASWGGARAASCFLSLFFLTGGCQGGQEGAGGEVGNNPGWGDRGASVDVSGWR